MKKRKLIGFRLFLLGLTLILVFIVPISGFVSGNDLNYIYSTFIGKKSDYNGIIEIWNIDSYESGIKSKSTYLEWCAKSFQKKNKGVYVLVRNLTQGECINLLSSGEKPDLISCSYGVADKIKDYCLTFESNDFSVSENILNAGKNENGKLVGLAWCMGFYSLISTKAKLEKANVDLENVKLNEIAYDCGYEYKVNKKQRNSVSLTYGTGDYLMPENALIAYNKARSIQTNCIEENELKLKSQYSAYSSFLANKATILLGTHRDIIRMMQREEKGKVSDVIYLPLTNWTDLVQFSFICKSDDSLRKSYAEKFAIFLTNRENQSQIESIGLFPVLKQNETLYKGAMRDIILENFSDLELKKLFS